MAKKRTSSHVTALIDGDVFVYQASAAAERPIQWDDDLWTLHSFLHEAEQDFVDKIETLLDSIREHTNKTVKAVVAFSDPTGEYFRKHIWPEYKANRKNKRHPLVRRGLQRYVENHYQTFTRPGLEADDVLGILQTSPYLVEGPRLIVSVDKDFKTVPGKFLNTGSGEFMNILPSQAAYFHMQQTLMGDSTDGYPGCPGIGPKTAWKLLDSVLPLGQLTPPTCTADDVYGLLWPVVVEAYEKAGLSADYALTMARLTRICQRDDYDFKKKEVILWNPPEAS